MTEVGAAVQEQLTTLMDEPCNARESQERRDTWMAYKKCRLLWLEGTMKVWTECLDPPKKKKAQDLESEGLQLVGTDVVENKILASRLVMAVAEKVHGQLEDLRLRMQFLEGTEELPGHDLLRPEVLVLLMVEQWSNSGMRGDSWSLVNEVVQKLLIERLITAYTNANEVLIKKGVMPTIELKDRVKSPVRGAPSRPRPPAGAPAPSHPQQQQPEAGTSGHGDFGQGGGYPQGAYPQGGGHGGHPSGPGGVHRGESIGPSGPGASGGNPAGGAAQGASPQRSGGFFGGRLGWGARPSAPSGGGQGTESAVPSGPSSSSPTPFWKQTGADRSTGEFRRATPPFRHCERSEAIQSVLRQPWIASSLRAPQ